ncbi:uncharacterized protein BT62DRAFT_230332 [Guyanagaster necrorhizus]|uniref:Uncharacterized protein n=1 Tax=Guyanagaster necrorhizus TaxID=856835 RepID=A0A9P8ASG4_9AGAR|nr:uncharacterized protein BT62DRAFT_230332 [Guyanagaster necrorhizus MCA 3950]KAG7444847.1 hypothetical protein BT62DRAFT_230332 [Guyanagaster necrorhizus MCA 3950]
MFPVPSTSDSHSASMQPPSNKRKLTLFTSSCKRPSRLSSLLSSSPSCSSSRKSAPTCTISLENVTINCSESYCVYSSSSDVNFIPFPTTTATSDSDCELEPRPEVGVKVRRRSMQATTPRSNERVRRDSQSRRRKAPSTRHHALLSPASHVTPPPKRFKGKHSDLRFLAVVWRSVNVSLQTRMDVDGQGDLDAQDRVLSERLGAYLIERGYSSRNEEHENVLSPSQLVAAATLRRKDRTVVRPTRNSAEQRRRSPLALAQSSSLLLMVDDP